MVIPSLASILVASFSTKVRRDMGLGLIKSRLMSAVAGIHQRQRHRVIVLRGGGR